MLDYKTIIRLKQMGQDVNLLVLMNFWYYRRN